MIAGVYAAKKLGNGQFNCRLRGRDRLRQDRAVGRRGSYPIQAVGAGFLRIKTSALQHVAKTLELPYCNMAERCAYPFFQPMIVDDGRRPVLPRRGLQLHSPLPPGRARCRSSTRRFGSGTSATTRIGIEEAAGQYIERSRNLLYQIGRPKPQTDAAAAILD